MTHAFMEEYAYSICETPYGADEAALILYELYCGLKDQWCKDKSSQQTHLTQSCNEKASHAYRFLQKTVMLQPLNWFSRGELASFQSTVFGQKLEALQTKREAAQIVLSNGFGLPQDWVASTALADR